MRNMLIPAAIGPLANKTREMGKQRVSHRKNTRLHWEVSKFHRGGISVGWGRSTESRCDGGRGGRG